MHTISKCAIEIDFVLAGVVESHLVQRAGACFLKVPKLLGPISGAKFPFISS